MSQDAKISRLRAGLIHTIKTLQTKTQTITQKTQRATTGIIQLAVERLLKPLLVGLDVATDTHRWRSAAVTVRSHKAEIIQFEERSVRPYLGLLVIALFVLVGNQANQKALAASSNQTALSVDIQPDVLHGILTAIDPLTPELDEQPDVVASMFISDSDLYLSRPDAATMDQAAQASKKDLIHYTVRKGDTMTTIAQSFGRTVATILDANNIKPEDASKIVPGDQLLIPQEDTSTSLAWLDAANQAEQQAAAARAQILAEAAQKKAQILASAGVSRALAAGPDKQTTAANFSGSTSIHSFILPISYVAIARGVGGGHMGIDYDAPVGTPVHAAAAGRVIEITHGWAGGFGNSVVVDHGGGLTTRYAHLSQVQVAIGQTVAQGQQIALSGNTGNSTGPHMHFQTELNGAVLNPYWLR